MVDLTTCCSWLILPVTWRLTSPTMRLAILYVGADDAEAVEGDDGLLGLLPLFGLLRVLRALGVA